MVSAPFYSISAPLLHFISITFWTLSIFSEAADKCKYANSIMHNAGQAGWNLLNCIKYELYTSSFNATCVTCICDVVPNTCHQRAVLERDQRASDISADANVGSLSEAGGDTWDLQPRPNCHTCEFYVQGRKLPYIICKRHLFLLHEKKCLSCVFPRL